ncbi:MAG TPA: protein-L-isoaspartate O-methyltransferase [Aliidongia sp.]|nr:protein-L-isoaspartate O-methyltransferase [Aliidongia sp.]
MNDSAQTRLIMVDSQLRPNKVTNPVLIAAFLDVPRERFAPVSLRGAAYLDEDLPIGRGRYLLEPMVLARLLQFASVRANDKVLDVGVGTGYSAAILAHLAGSVTALESDAAFAAQAKALLLEIGSRNVAVVEGPLEAGSAVHGPYDVILLNGAVREIPDALVAQLGDNGRLLGVIKTRPDAMGQAILIEKIGSTASRRVLFEAGSHVLPGFAVEPAFSF